METQPAEPTSTQKTLMIYDSYAARLLIGQLVLLLFCAVSIGGFVWLWLRTIRREQVRVELQRQIYLARPSAKATFVVTTILAAAFMVFLGLTAVGSGLFAGWGLVAMAVLPLGMLAIYAYVARLPYTYPEDL